MWKCVPFINNKGAPSQRNTSMYSLVNGSVPSSIFVINWTWEIRVKTAIISGQTLVKKPFEDPREDHPLIVAVNPLMVELVWRPPLPFGKAEKEKRNI